MAQARDIMDSISAITMHVIRTTVTTTLGSTPLTLAFNRDMSLNFVLVANWRGIVHCREHHVNENLRRANSYVAGNMTMRLDSKF